MPLLRSLHLYSTLHQDGNFFWEIGFTERPEWIEPDRWHQTVCNFMLVRASRQPLSPRRLR